MTPHAALLAAICDWFKERKIWYVRTNNHGYGRKGIPDVLACWQGKFIAVEAKVAPDKPSAWQTRELRAIHDAGGIALVVFDVAEMAKQLMPTIAYEPVHVGPLYGADDYASAYKK